MLKYRPITAHSLNALLQHTIANVLDCVVAVITITFQYPYIDANMCWCTLGVRACVYACVKHRANNFVKLACP